MTCIAYFSHVSKTFLNFLEKRFFPKLQRQSFKNSTKRVQVSSVFDQDWMSYTINNKTGQK